jgi:hypothetical protein
MKEEHDMSTVTIFNEKATLPPEPSPVEVITGLALGYLVSRSLHVATELGIADLLNDGPQHVEELASRTGTHPASLYRLLRSLAAHGVFREDEAGRFALTPAAALLQRGVMRDGVLLCGEVTGDGSWWNAVGALRHSIMTGEPAFHRQHGLGFFDYVRLHPASSAWFDRGLANFAAAENPAIAGAYDFSSCSHIIDVGGGQGGLIAEILKRYQGPKATLFDLPHVVNNPAYLEKETFSHRWTTAGGDFFEGVPRGGDVYVLKRILHDWSDEDCLRILRSCREAMTDTSRLLVVDAVIPPGNARHPGKVMDILMMVLGEGHERTAREFEELLARAGLHLSNIITTASALAIVEAVPV